MLTLATLLCALLAAPPQEVEVSRDRVGPLLAGSRLDEASLKAAFPGYLVAKVANQGPGGFPQPGHSWDITRPDRKRVMFLTLGRSGCPLAAHIVSPDLRTSHGARVGAPVASVARLPGLRCALFAEEEGWLVECASARASNISYFFVPTKAEQKALEGQKEKKAFKPANVRGRKIESVFWRSPTPCQE